MATALFQSLAPFFKAAKFLGSIWPYPEACSFHASPSYQADISVCKCCGTKMQLKFGVGFT